MRTRGRQCTWPGVAVLVALMALGVPLSGLLAAGTHSDGQTEAGRASTLVTGPPFWLPVASMHGARVGGAAVLGLDRRIYALGGNIDPSAQRTSTVEVYTPATNTWHASAPLLYKQYAFAAATGPDGAIYVISGGGAVLNAKGIGPVVATLVEAYLPLQNRWTRAPDIPTQHLFGAATRGPDGRLYVFGGTNGVDGLPEVDAYDVHTRHWTHVTDMPTPRASLGVATGLDGRIYTMGGNPGMQIDSLSSVEAYDVWTKRWQLVAHLPTVRQYLGAAAGPDGRIYAIGGYGADNGTSITNVDAYDPRTNRWVAVAPLGTPRSRLAAVRGADGRIYAIGGFQGREPQARGMPTDPADLLATVEAYGPILYLTPQSAPAGNTMVLTGTNFAVHATVRVTWGGTPGGSLLGIGRTDHRGNLLHALRVRVPAGVRPGQYGVTAMDNRSRYPVIVLVTVMRRAP